MAFCDEDVTIGCGHDTGRFGQRVRRIPRYSRFAECKQHVAIGTEFDDDMALCLFFRVLLALPLVRTSFSVIAATVTISNINRSLSGMRLPLEKIVL